MVTFYEVKSLLSRIVCGKNLEEDNSSDIIIDSGRFRGSGLPQEDSQIVIKNSDIQELYDKVMLKKFDNLQLYDESCYEIAFYLDDPRM